MSDGIYVSREELDKLKTAFREYSREMETKIDRALMRAGAKVEAQAKKLFKGRDEVSVPSEPPRVQTGRLRGSITHRLTGELTKPVVEIGTNVTYGKWLELGSSRTKIKHPFMYPALALKRDEVYKIIKEGST